MRWKLPAHCSGSKACFCAALAVGLLSSSVAVAEEPIGRHWPSDQLMPLNQVEHTSLDTLLKKYVDDEGWVNYSQWHQSRTDRNLLIEYLNQLSRADPSVEVSSADRIAFWINAYNALTIEGILRVYPTDSIRNHTARLVGYNIWTDLFLRVGGRDYSLDDIEHKVLRKLHEPRIHFALVCASAGCPKLRNEAWRADRLETQLAENAKNFFQRPANLSLAPDGSIQLSPLLDWYGEDFGRDRAEQFKALAPYIPERLRPAWDDPERRVTFTEYDWSLNDQRRKPPQP